MCGTPSPVLRGTTSPWQKVKVVGLLYLFQIGRLPMHRKVPPKETSRQFTILMTFSRFLRGVLAAGGAPIWVGI